jgi:hypothetical protein
VFGLFRIGLVKRDRRSPRWWLFLPAAQPRQFNWEWRVEKLKKCGADQVGLRGVAIYVGGGRDGHIRARGAMRGEFG